MLTDPKKPQSLQKVSFRFAPGDSLDWASPMFSDSSWQVVNNTAFGTDQYSDAALPKGWKGFGWFRIWLKKANDSLTNTWGMFINQDGASEIYWDGKRVGVLGRVGASAEAMIASRQPYLAIPLAITDTLPHLLAIRYSNYTGPYPNFHGFQAQIQDLHIMNSRQKAHQRMMDQLLMSVAAACILIVLHLLLFIFYPRQKINLYYILFVGVVALGLYARYETIVTTDPLAQVFYSQVFMGFVTLNFSFGLLLLYYAGYGYIPRRKTIIMLLLSVPVAVWAIVDWYRAWTIPAFDLFQKWYQNVFMLVFFTDVLLVLLRSIRRGNKKLWLLVAGMILFILLGIFVGSNQLNWFTLNQVMIFFGWGNLLMPVVFSIYMAMDIASTNRKLAAQLKENDRLAAENIAKEQEKNKLISEQAEQLEKTVLERTAQLREQSEKLREMDAAKSRFFVNLTHEFKTPLTLIINPAKELLQHPDAATAKQYAGYILQNSERLLQLINQLLDLSRIESGQMDIRYQPIDIVKWLRMHVQQFGSLAEHNHIKLEFASGLDQLWVEADMDKLEKIVQNLVSNALKFIHTNGAVAVSLHKKDEHQLLIKVKDNGIGISREKQPYIFDRFYQADASDTRTREGAGIGLALVKELTTLLNGTIEVESAEDIGTTFTVILPYQPAKESEGEITPEGGDEEQGYLVTEPVAAVAEHDRDHKETILIAEDNDQLRQFIELSLSDSYQVLTAKDGIEGIDIALEAIPTLAITDLMMPGKNGYQLCDALKKDERTSHIPVIMLTAKTDQDSKIQGIKTGADAYLAKPFDKTELLALIENLIENRKVLKEKFSKNNSWLNSAVELPSIEQNFLTRIKESIQSRLDDVQFGAEELGREVGLSRTQLHRKLKGIIGQTPGELIRSIRMQQAHELLQKNIGTVAEVGYMVGYGNPANFSTSFAKHFGYPPSEVGKQA